MSSAQRLLQVSADPQFCHLLPLFLQVVPSTAIGFTLYDYCKSALALPTNL